MAETDAIGRTPDPMTVARLESDLQKIGVRPAMTLLVHCSLSSLGWVCGGAVAVILALERLLGEEGTLVMPAFSGNLSDPAYWVNPPVPAAWWPLIRSEMPPFDADLTPTRCMGVVAETFRKQPGALRSNHPQVSFVARGKQAGFITRGHSLNYAFGEKSPVARLYELDGRILLLGVSYARNSSLHLAEFRAEYAGKKLERSGTPVTENGRRVWREVEDFAGDCGDFEQIGEALEESCPGTVVIGRIGQASARLMQSRALVDFAVGWIEANRK